MNENALLKKIARRWPDYGQFSMSNGVHRQLYLSTLVPIYRENKWWLVHCVESVVITEGSGLMALPTVHSLYRRFIKSVDDIKNLYQLCGLEDLDENQHTNLKQLTQ